MKTYDVSRWVRLRTRASDAPEDLFALYRFFRASGHGRLHAAYRALYCIV